MATMASASVGSLTSMSSAQNKSSYNPSRPRKFAPLRPELAKQKKTGEAAEDLPRLKGVIFDVDGTLCLPQNYMFRQMREALQIPKSVDILDHIRSLPNEADGGERSGSSVDTVATTTDENADSLSSPQSRAAAKIRAIERSAMTSQTPQPGLVELMTYLNARYIPTGLCTRNFPAPVQHLIDHFLAPHGISFVPEEVITREAKGIQPKPSPEGIWTIAKYWATTVSGFTTQQKEVGMEEGRRPPPPTSDNDSTVSNENEGDVLTVARQYLGSGLIMVGDSVDDMAAGHRAGAATVLLVNEDNAWLANHEYTDLSITRLDELVEIFEQGFVGTTTTTTEVAAAASQKK